MKYCITANTIWSVTKKKVPCDDNSQYQKRRFSLLLASNVQPQTITEVYCIQFSYIQ